jgi:hypothetical protein
LLRKGKSIHNKPATPLTMKKIILIGLALITSTTGFAAELTFKDNTPPIKVKNCNLYIPNSEAYKVLEQNGFKLIPTNKIAVEVNNTSTTLGTTSGTIGTEYTSDFNPEKGDLYFRMSGHATENALGWMQSQTVVQILEKSDYAFDEPEARDYKILAPDIHKNRMALPSNSLLDVRALPTCK